MSLTRKQALAQGYKRYFTGNPCPQGHTTERRTHNGECCECTRLYYLKRAKDKRKVSPEWSGRKASAYRKKLSNNVHTTAAAALGVAKALVRQARRRAKEKGIPFSIKPEDILPLPQTCPVLGLPLVYLGSERNDKDNAASLDRVDNDRGYVPGNIQIISWRANHIKTDATITELESVLKYMRNSMT